MGLQDANKNIWANALKEIVETKIHKKELLVNE